MPSGCRSRTWVRVALTSTTGRCETRRATCTQLRHADVGRAQVRLRAHGAGHDQRNEPLPELSQSFIWNNGADHAYLRTPTGALADQCAWTDSYTGTAARAKAC